MLHFNNKKKGISVAALSVAAIVVVTLASVITISLVRNLNDAKKIEFAQELNMLKLAVDNYYYENGTYPVSDNQLILSNVPDNVKQDQFRNEVENNGTYTFNVIDYNLIGINSLKYGRNIDDDYDIYVVSTDTGRVYYAKGLKIGNKIYYTLDSELNTFLVGNSKLENNSNNGILFSETKLNDGNISVKINIPTNYQINSVTFENTQVNLLEQNDNYYTYLLKTKDVGTINVDYTYNSDVKNAKYTITNNEVENVIEANLIIKLSTEQPTQGPISASISYQDEIPSGYVIQYKIDDGEWTSGNKVNEITENCVIYCRLYSSSLNDVITETFKKVKNIDKIAPIITDVTGNATEWTNANVILTVNGAEDKELGLHDTQPYSFDGGITWQKSNVKLFEDNRSNIIIKVKDKAGNVYTHEAINIEYIDKKAPTITSVTGNATSLTTEDITLTVNGAKDDESGLHETEPYSFDGGVTWQKENSKTYTENTSNIIIKVKDKVGNVYTHDEVNVELIDKKAPTIIDVTGNAETWTKGDVTLTVNGAEDVDSGLAEKPYSFDGGATWQTSNSKTYTENTSNIVIKVKDNIGNIYTHEKIDIIYIDKINPTIIDVTGNSSTWTNSDVTLTVNGAEDSLSGLHEEETYSFDGGVTWQKENSKTYIENTSNIVIKVKDKVGNIYTHEVINVEYIDKEAPTADEIIGNIQYWSKWDVSINVNNAKDNGSGLAEKPFSFDDGLTWQNENHKIFSENTSNIIVKIKDKVGNIYTHEPINIEYLDKEAPSKPTGLDIVSSLNSLTVKASGSTDDKSGLAGYKYSLDNENWSEIIKDDQTYTFDSIKANTSVEVYVKAIDNVGWESSVYGPVNAATSEVTNKVAITLSEDTWTKGPITAELSYDNVPAGYEIQYRVGDGNWTSGTKTEDIEENTTVTARLYNASLDDEIAVNSKAIAYIDTTAPTDVTEINIITRELDSITVKAFGSTDSGIGVEGYQYSKDGTTWSEVIASEHIYTINDLTENTSYTVYARAVDRVGNISEKNFSKKTSTLSTYNVIYDSNTSDSVSNLPISEVKIEGKTLIISTVVPQREGYIFAGWEASDVSGKPIYGLGAAYTEDSDVTLYAVWEKAYYENTNTGEYYKTLEDSLKGSESDTEIKVIADVTDSSTAINSSDKNITLNLNGKTINKTDYTIQNDGVITLTGDGILTTNSEINLITNTGTLNDKTVGTISNTNTGAYNTILTTGVLNKTGTGTITSNVSTRTIECGTDSQNLGTINISAGKVETISGGAAIGNSDVLNITGGSIISTYGCAICTYASTFTISGEDTLIQKNGNATGAAINYYGKGNANFTDGKIYVYDSNSRAIYFAGTGKITINGLDIQNDGTGWGISNLSTGTVEMISGTITAASCFSNDSTGKIIIGSNDSNVSTTDPVLSAGYTAINVTAGTVEIYDGDIHSTNRAALVNDGGTITLDGANIITDNYYGLLSSSGEVNIKSGTLTGNKWECIYNGYANINISGGTVNAPNHSGIRNNAGVLTITGGKIVAKSSGAYNYYVDDAEGTIILGSNDGIVSTNSPEIIGNSNYGIESTYGTFKYYDGVIKGAIGTINGNISDKPSGYEVYTTTENSLQTAILSKEITAEMIKSVPQTYIGATVQYSGYSENTNNITWRIFNVTDSGVIQLIANDYVDLTYKGTNPATNVVVNGYIIKSSTDRTSLINYLTTQSNWSEYAISGKTTAVGAPTIEEFCSSYKLKYPNNYIVSKYVSAGEKYNGTDTTSADGYVVKFSTETDTAYSYSKSIGISDDLYIKTGTSYGSNTIYGAWLGSASAYGSGGYVLRLNYNGNVYRQRLRQ